MLKGEFEFPLEEKIEYAVGGDTKTAMNIVVKAPCYNDTKNVLKLHSLINQAMVNMRLRLQQGGEETKQPQESKREASLNSSDIVTILLNAGCDTDAIIDIFTQILIKSGKLDGTQELVPFLLQKLSPQTILKLLGEYVINFPLAV